MDSCKTFEACKTTKHFETPHKEIFVVEKNPPLRYKEYIAPSNIILCNSPTNAFQAAMKYTILIGQFFGLNPVLGICEQNTSKLRFTFLSLRCLYAIACIIGQGTIAILCLKKTIKDADSSLAANTSVVFFATNCLTTALFLQVARKWPKLCQSIAELEDIDPIEDNTLVRKCNFSFGIIISLAIIEHLLSDLSGIASSLNCQPDKELLDAFLHQSYPMVWAVVPFSYTLSAVIKFICIQSTFVWNYSNVFIICVSWYLVSRLDHINQRILKLKDKAVPSSIWMLLREDYSRATQLVRSVDEVVGGVVFVSFAHNLFSICMQLLHALEMETKSAYMAPCSYNTKGPLNGYEHTVYFMYSATFLITRSLAVSLIPAKVHSTSRIPAEALYQVTPDDYSVEVQRFLAQVHGDTVALTGYNFFHVTRGLVLVIAGTIVTYELVFMQFAGVTTVTPTTATLADSKTGS